MRNTKLFHLRGITQLGLHQDQPPACTEFAEPFGRTPIDLRLDKHASSRRQRSKHRSNRRHPVWKQQRPLRIVQLRQQTLSHTTHIIVIAAIDISRGMQCVVTIACKSCARLDGGHNATTGRINIATRLCGYRCHRKTTFHHRFTPLVYSLKF